MSKLIASAAISGAHAIVRQAEHAVARAIEARGVDCAVGFPNTAYSLPVIYSLLGVRVDRLGDARPVLEECKNLLPPVPTQRHWTPYLGPALDAGIATLFAFELIEACKYVVGPDPVSGIWLGAADDVIIRERGIEFVDGSAPGFAAVVGAAPDSETAVRIARELQEKNLYVFMSASTHGRTFAQQLDQAGVELGWDTRLVPYGDEISATIYALGFASRVALSFGGVEPGDFTRNLLYNKNRVFAFVLALGEVDERKYAAAAGAISYGFPTIADTDIPQILPRGICTYEHVVSSVPHDRIVEKCLEVRGCKIRITKVPIPVAYGPAFEGERIRKEQTHLEFGGNITPGFEYVTTREVTEVEDGRIEVVGPDGEDLPPGSALPLAIWVDVAGRKMQPDFEPILERQIHHMINGAEGVWHMGQRDIIWVRISKAAWSRGFRLRHFGEILHAKLINDYPAIVDKVQVTLFTDVAEVEPRLAEARQVYRSRNQRLASLTDESVDTFYSCLLCQSFAPNHVCIITPERLGLCGAYNWLDGKAAFEIDPTGPNQPVSKGECIDPVRGQWAEINDYVYANSRQTLDRFNAYSIVEYPMTSCGCFEAIVAVLPECNGVMIVNREYTGQTPLGMTFSALAGSTGGGQQTPGFIGVGKAYISSPKFISAEGGQRRIVWMPGELKQQLREELELVGQRVGIDNFAEMVADDTIGVDVASVRAHMEQVGHPALEMWEIMGPPPDADAGPTAPTERTEEEREMSTRSKVPPRPTTAPAPPRPAAGQPSPVDGLGYVTSVLERLRGIDLPMLPSGEGTPEQQLAALQVSTAVNLLTAGANMLLMHSGLLGATPPSRAPSAPPPPAPPVATPPPAAAPAPRQEKAAVAPAERPFAPARIEQPSSFNVPEETVSLAVSTVTLGRNRQVTIGGARALPFRHFDGHVGQRPLIAMEVFDTPPKNYPPSLRQAYGDKLLADPAAMARHCVEQLGAGAISVRLIGAHPEQGNRSPEDAVWVVESVLDAVDVPVIVTGCSHYEKNNAVLKLVAGAFAGANLLLSWVENDNFKTIAAAAMAYDHCLVAQSPMDVNLAKQLNILLTNMGVKPDRIVIDALTGALGYGLEYTYSVMERIRTTAFTGDRMLAMPMIGNVGFEVACIKESRAPQSEFPHWGPDTARGPLLEIATAMALLNSGADLLIMYHPEAVRTVDRKIDEMSFGIDEA
jgi:acetyl-CoA synthase